jgi:hypothetical protein
MALGDQAPTLRAAEVAAMQVARELLGKLVPQVHIAPSQDGELDVSQPLTPVRSLSFIFVDRAKGLPYSRWPNTSTSVDRRLSENWYDSLILDVARYMIKLSTKSYNGIGSLTFNSRGDVVVGPLLSSPINVFYPARLPVCTTSAQLRIAQLDYLLGLVRTKLLGWNKALMLETRPLWTYIVYLEARDLVRGCTEMHLEQQTYLRHVDENDGQYLTRQNGKLSAFLDFEL